MLSCSVRLRSNQIYKSCRRTVLGPFCVFWFSSSTLGDSQDQILHFRPPPGSFRHSSILSFVPPFVPDSPFPCSSVPFCSHSMGYSEQTATSFDETQHFTPNSLSSTACWLTLCFSISSAMCFFRFQSSEPTLKPVITVDTMSKTTVHICTD